MSQLTSGKTAMIKSNAPRSPHYLAGDYVTVLSVSGDTARIKLASGRETSLKADQLKAS